jgi:acetyltransferase-like isoleucine patch superfamily enzyme
VIIASSCSLREAADRRLLDVHETAIVAADIRIVPFEDNGESFGSIRIGPHARIRGGVIISSGVTIGARTLIGHQVVIRKSVSIGSDTVISHLVCLERDVRIGDRCRISSLTHLTGSSVVEDDAQIGAGVATVNANQFQWRNGGDFIGPTFRRGCRVASGVTVLGAVEVGAHAIVGAGAVVTRSIPAGVVAYGVPAYVQRELTPEELSRPDPGRTSS